VKDKLYHKFHETLDSLHLDPIVCEYHSEGVHTTIRRKTTVARDGNT